MKVFLGGTCNNSTWRDSIIPLLNMDYFNPVVKDWTLECQAEEIRQRETCDCCLYTITPKMTGVYSIAEVVDDSNKRPAKTILCLIREDFSDDLNGLKSFKEREWKSLNAVADLVRGNGGQVFFSLSDVATELNRRARLVEMES